MTAGQVQISPPDAREEWEPFHTIRIHLRFLPTTRRFHSFATLRRTAQVC
jgi:hypothetical protein